VAGAPIYRPAIANAWAGVNWAAAILQTPPRVGFAALVLLGETPILLGAGGGTRTHTTLPSRDFKSLASTSSATSARLFHNAFSASGNECFADRPLRFAKQVRGAFPPLIVERDDGRYQIGAVRMTARSQAISLATHHDLLHGGLKTKPARREPSGSTKTATWTVKCVWMTHGRWHMAVEMSRWRHHGAGPQAPGQAERRRPGPRDIVQGPFKQPPTFTRRTILRDAT